MSAPLIAGMLVRAGHPARYDDASSIYANPGAFNDVVGGSNGYCGKRLPVHRQAGVRRADRRSGTPNGLGGL